MTPEQEWRTLLLSEIKEIRSGLADLKSEMTTLKVKVALFSSVIGSIAAFISNKIF